MSTPSPAKIHAAFAAVYLIWGSTYLAIRYCVATMPPFLMAGSRFLLAGGVLYALARLTGAPAPERKHWRSCSLIGALLILAGNGLVVWSAQRLPSSTSALLIAMVPLWFALLAWAFRGERPTGQGMAGVLLGLAGVGMLIAARSPDGSAPVDPAGAVAMLFASLAWAGGSVLAKALPLPSSPMVATSMEMIAGGAFSLVAGLAFGEGSRLALDRISTVSWLAFAYLIVFGSLVGFSAYSYLIGVVSPARLSTYAYVNPVVALVLGATLGGEHLSARTLQAAAVILCGVLLMSSPPFRSLPRLFAGMRPARLTGEA